MNKDPVCGAPIDAAQPRYTSEYQGETYYFCSAACQQRFEQDPQRYVRLRSARSDA